MKTQLNNEAVLQSLGGKQGSLLKYSLSADWRERKQKIYKPFTQQMFPLNNHFRKAQLVWIIIILEFGGSAATGENSW